jgi:hypothetical protein
MYDPVAVSIDPLLRRRRHGHHRQRAGVAGFVRSVKSGCQQRPVRWDTDAGKQWKMVGAFCPTALDNDLISRCKRTPPPGYHSQNALAGRSSCVPREEPWSCGTCPPSEPDSTVVSRRRLTVPPMGKSSAGEDRLRALVPHAGATPKRSRQLGAVPNALS